LDVQNPAYATRIAAEQWEVLLCEVDHRMILQQ
jgi:hypothetical protein